MKLKSRSCATCGASGMTHDHRDVSRVFEGVTIRIAGVKGWFCPVCNEVEFDTPTAARKFFDDVKIQQDEIRKQRAAEVKAIRKQLKLTQRQAAELLGGGINAFSEYERGVTRPARPTLLLLHLLSRHPELLQEIRREAA